VENALWRATAPMPTAFKAPATTPRGAIDYKAMASKTPAKTLSAEEYTDILELVGMKAFFKFRNVKDAFRTIDQDRSGSVDKQEMQAFFRQFSLPEETASLLFDYLDRDESGELDYVEFMRHFGPIIQPGVPPPVTYRNPLAGDGGTGHSFVAGISLRKLG